MGALGEKVLDLEGTYVCTQCGAEHKSTGLFTVVPQPVVFGGGGKNPQAVLWAVQVSCPTTGEVKEELLRVAVPDGQRIVSVRAINTVTTRTPDEPKRAGSLAAPEESGPPLELSDARKNSIPTLRAFATTLLTTTTGGVPIYFTVLTFLGTNKSPPPWRWLSVIPPILLILAAGGFVASLLPSVKYVEGDEFGNARWAHIEQMSRRVRFSTFMLLLAAIAAAVVFQLYSIY